MEGLGAPQSPPPPAAAAISAVLDDDDLLCEILLRVAFPTSLVRTALVCKRWLGLASAPAFLRRFRGLHPPRLLGFYVATRPTTTPRFVPIPQPPELADVVRRGSFSFYLNLMGCGSLDVRCWNGLLLLSSYVRNQPNQTVRILRCPLYPATYTAILPPVPETCIHDGFTYDDYEILPNGGGHGLPYFCLAIGHKDQEQSVFDLYVLLQRGTWAIYSSAVCEIHISLLGDCLIGDGKIYSVVCLTVSDTRKLFMLNLVSSPMSLVNLPEEVDLLSVHLSLADHSGVHLTLVKDFQIRTWLHRTGVAGWFLVNTICLRDICATNMIPSQVFEVQEHFIRICAVEENSQFVLLEKDDVIYMFDLRRKDAKKVYEPRGNEYLYDVIPFMMVWPPKFPV